MSAITLLSSDITQMYLWKKNLTQFLEILIVISYKYKSSIVSEKLTLNVSYNIIVNHRKCTTLEGTKMIT